MVGLKQDFTVTSVGLQAGGWHPSGERGGSPGLGGGLTFMGGTGWVGHGGWSTKNSPGNGSHGFLT